MNTKLSKKQYNKLSFQLLIRIRSVYYGVFFPYAFAFFLNEKNQIKLQGMGK